MGRVTTVGNAATGDRDAPSWEEVEQQFIGLKNNGFWSLSVDDNTAMVILLIAEFGYLVSGQAVGDIDFYTLIDSTLGDDPVTAFDGGNTNEYPRYAFVSTPLLLKAMKTYYFTGQRDETCEWVLSEDTMY